MACDAIGIALPTGMSTSLSDQIFASLVTMREGAEVEVDTNDLSLQNQPLTLLLQAAVLWSHPSLPGWREGAGEKGLYESASGSKNSGERGAKGHLVWPLIPERTKVYL